MSIKSILVGLDGSPNDRMVVETALAVGKMFNAWVDGLIARPDPNEAVRLVVDGMSPAMIEGVLTAAEADAHERAHRAEQAFSEACEARGINLHGDSEAGVHCSWSREVGDPAEVIARRGRVSDLVVLGHPGAHGSNESFATVEIALFDTGRPLLLAADKGPTSLLDCIVIAWNGTRESARAVAGAKPFLFEAKRVIVVTVDETGLERPSGEQLCHYLSRHGVSASLHAVESGGRVIGDHILEEAKRLEARMLVMGAYSQSRLKEFMLGGVTRRLLGKAELPLLIAH